MMNHEEAQELLAVYALDAVDGTERLALESHLEDCVRCANELDALRGVTSAMGNVSEAAPAHLWRRISEHLYDDVGPETAPSFPTLEAPMARVTPITASRRARPRRATLALGALSAAAVLLIAVLGVNLARANNHVAQLTNALGVADRGAVVAAQSAPGHVDVTLSNSHTANLATFVLLHGHGYLVSSHMSTLPASQTYQLWGIFDGKPISIGLMGTSPTGVTFTVASSLTPSELAITVEPASGATQPTTPIVASGIVTA